MLARDRIQALIDPGTEFLGLSPFAGWELYEGYTLAIGIITGIIIVANNGVLFSRSALKGAHFI